MSFVLESRMAGAEFSWNQQEHQLEAEETQVLKNNLFCSHTAQVYILKDRERQIYQS